MTELTLRDHTSKLAAVDAAQARERDCTSGARARTCVGCRQARAREDLVRFVATGDGSVAFDLAGKAWGRGAWVHARSDCLARSVRGLSRAFKRPITLSSFELREALVAAASRHVGRLLAAAKRAGKLEVGGEAAERACRDCRHVTLIVAQDMRATESPCLAQILSTGRVLVVPSMTKVGEWLGVQGFDLAVLTDSKMTKAIARTIAIAQIPAPARGSRGSDTGTEVG